MVNKYVTLRTLFNDLMSYINKIIINWQVRFYEIIMKTMSSKFFIVIIYLMGITIAFAGPHPPSPGFKKPPPPPGLPIDEHIFIVLIFALLYGLYIILRHKLTTKNPV
jgi:hypothetical protein